MISSLLRHSFIDRFDLQQTHSIIDQSNVQSLWWWNRKKEEEIEVDAADDEFDRTSTMTYEQLVEQIETPLYLPIDSDRKRLSDEELIKLMESTPID